MASLTIAAAIDEGRRPLSQAEMTALRQAATREFASHAEAFGRALNHRTALIAAGVLVGTALVAGGGGYYWGRSAARADTQQTEAGLQAAFSRGPEAAKDWWALMTWNDPRKALAQCQGPAVSVQAGRRVCTVPLWVEPPPASGR